jgi:hypothetical protein
MVVKGWSSVPLGNNLIEVWKNKIRHSGHCRLAIDLSASYRLLPGPDSRPSPVLLRLSVTFSVSRPCRILYLGFASLGQLAKASINSGSKHRSITSLSSTTTPPQRSVSPLFP